MILYRFLGKWYDMIVYQKKIDMFNVWLRPQRSKDLQEDIPYHFKRAWSANLKIVWYILLRPLKPEIDGRTSFSWSNLRKLHQNQYNCRPLAYTAGEVVVTPTVVWSEHLRGLWSEHLQQIMCSHNTYTSCVVTRPTLNNVYSEDLHYIMCSQKTYT
jgi:hypothetical protein